MFGKLRSLLFLGKQSRQSCGVKSHEDPAASRLQINDWWSLAAVGRWGWLGWAGGEGRDVELKLNMLTEAQIYPCGPTARSVF